MKKTKQEISDETWEYSFQMAKSFYEKNGHLLIPGNYIYHQKRLGRWIETQRQNYHKKEPLFYRRTY